MLRIHINLTLILTVVMLCGCSTIEGTANGMKKDAESVYNYMNKEDGWMKKTDNWMQEHLW